MVKLPSNVFSFTLFLRLNCTFSGYCVKFENRSQNYEGAAKFCKAQDDSILAYPQNENDIAFFKMLGAQDKTVFGLSDESVEGNWVTSDEMSYEG